eukprot:gene43638-59099_t
MMLPRVIRLSQWPSRLCGTGLLMLCGAGAIFAGSVRIGFGLTFRCLAKSALSDAAATTGCAFGLVACIGLTVIAIGDPDPQLDSYAFDLTLAPPLHPAQAV